MAERIRGLLFDKDGTLFDFKATWGEWARQFFVEVASGDAALAAEMGAHLGYHFDDDRFEPGSIIIAGTPEEEADALVAAYPHLDHADIIRRINIVAAGVAPMPPVPLAPLLEGFRARGLRLGVATNDAEVPARAHLGRAGVTPLFDFIAGFDSGFGAKPAPGMHRAFCAATALAPAEVAMVGDSIHDLVSGRAAGMVTVAVLTGIAGAHDLAPHADVVLDHIGHLPDWLARRND